MTKGEALIKLRDFLKELPEEKFNFDKWVTSYKRDRDNNFCGTVCCAYGWIPQAIPELGVTWFYSEYDEKLKLTRSHTVIFGDSSITRFIFLYTDLAWRINPYPFYDTELHGNSTEVTLTNVINRINTVLELYPIYCNEEIVL